MYEAEKLIKLLNLACSTNKHEAATAAAKAWAYIIAHDLKRDTVDALRKLIYRPEIISWLYKTMRYESKGTASGAEKEKEKAHSGKRYESNETPNDSTSKARSSRKKEPRYESSDTYPKNCEQCGRALVDLWAWGESQANSGTNFGRPRHFCSDACKQRNYRQRQKQKRRA